MTNARLLKPPIHFSGRYINNQRRLKTKIKDVICLKYLLLLHWCPSYFTMLLKYFYILLMMQYVIFIIAAGRSRKACSSPKPTASTHQGSRCHQHQVCCDARWVFVWQHPTWAPSPCQRSDWCSAAMCTWSFCKQGIDQSLQRDPRLASPSGCILSRWLVNTPMS